ncbi:MAG: hypothetical protein K0S80_4946 [Neobacillus sp.]|nr:hypothetical protein [Neobacillus sp.]
MAGQDIIVCSNCGSNKVKKSDMDAFLPFAIILCIVIPIVGWFLLPFTIIYYVKSIKNGKRFVCRECKYAFDVEKEKYLKYKETLRM